MTRYDLTDDSPPHSGQPREPKPHQEGHAEFGREPVVRMLLGGVAKAPLGLPIPNEATYD